VLKFVEGCVGHRPMEGINAVRLRWHGVFSF
jgi:hypothetical protein